MPVRLAADVQLMRWKPDPVKARSFVFAEKAVVVDGNEKEPPSFDPATPKTLIVPLVAVANAAAATASIDLPAGWNEITVLFPMATRLEIPV